MPSDTAAEGGRLKDERKSWEGRKEEWRREKRRKGREGRGNERERCLYGLNEGVVLLCARLCFEISEFKDTTDCISSF